tara:strand:- start:5014 stop:5277 length:264 start_codon:yes stop_codon:yes gene_type:complete
LTSRQNRIEARLTEEFSPVLLNIVDESRLHEGHAGASEAGESHFFVEIAAPAFAGKSRIECHRMVNQALASEFAAGLHALRLKTRAE